MFVGSKNDFHKLKDQLIAFLRDNFYIFITLGSEVRDVLQCGPLDVRFELNYNYPRLPGTNSSSANRRQKLFPPLFGVGTRLSSRMKSYFVH